MTLSNEQRAHDIVMAMLPRVVDYKVDEEREKSLENDTPVKKVEVVPLYLEMYKSALDKLNTMLPKG